MDKKQNSNVETLTVSSAVFVLNESTSQNYLTGFLCALRPLGGTPTQLLRGHLTGGAHSFSTCLVFGVMLNELFLNRLAHVSGNKHLVIYANLSTCRYEQKGV